MAGAARARDGAAALEGQLTRDFAHAGDIALAVDLDNGAGPGNVKVSLDDHVGCRRREESLVGWGANGGRAGGRAEGREGGSRSLEWGKHGGRGVVVGCETGAGVS